jgi:hypothetical protein
MKLTPENKAYIDRLSYEGLLSRWRNAPLGDRWFQDETGEYWGARLQEMRKKETDNGVAVSKRIGWETTDSSDRRNN